MKNTKRFVIAILSLVLALSCAALILSACNESSFTVTVAKYDTTQGSVTVSQPASGDKYKKGESVTVTVTAASGYEVASFSVSGQNAALTNSQYTFTVESDTTVTVAFRKMTSSARYSVTLNYNAQKGSVQLSAPADGDKYASGESVTVTVTPAAGYKVASFSVGGHSDAALTDGAYTFTITGDTVILVAFEMAVIPEMTDQLLNPLRGTVLFEGQVEENDFLYGELFITEMSTLFDDVHKAVWLQEWYRGNVIFSAIYRNVDGKAARLQHDENGKLSAVKSESDFEEFYNPFVWLSTEDFECIDYGVWSISDSAKAADASTAITGYSGENIESFLLYEEEGVITRMVITVARVTHVDAGMDYQDIYYFDVVEHDAETMPDEWFGDYRETQAHAELREALQKAYEATNYTVHYYSHEEGFEDVYYDMFATPNGIYENNEGWEGGFIERTDGHVWWFSYDPTTEKFDFENQPLNGVDSIYDIFARFDLDALGISYSILESKGNGVFELRFFDTSYLKEDENGEVDEINLAGAMAALFSTGSDQRQYFATAVDFRITLQDGELYKVEFSYNYYGYIRELVVLTFDDFDETTLPIDVSDEAFYGMFSEDYIGSWVDELARTTVVITLDRLTVNGQQIEDVTKQANGYAFTLNGEESTLTYSNSDQTLVLNSGRSRITLSSTSCKWTKYIGVYEGADNKGAKYTVLVSEQGIVVICDGEAIVSQAISLGTYAGYEYLLFVSRGVDYEFGEDDNGIYLYSDGELSIDVYLDRIASEDCVWYNYIGLYRLSYMGVSYEIAITSKTIYVTVDGEKTEVADITFDNSGFTFTLGNESYCISNSNMYRNEVNTIAFYPEADIQDYIELDRVSGNGSISFDRLLVGTWEDESGAWKIVITANSLTINGEEIYSVEYVGFGIYDVYYHDMSCMLTLRDGVLYFTQGENDIFVTLTKTDTGFDPSTSDWSKFVGTYRSNDGKYEIVITSDGVQVTIDGNEATVKIRDFYDNGDQEAYFELEVNGEIFSIVDTTYDNPVSRISYGTSDYSIYVFLYRVTD